MFNIAFLLEFGGFTEFAYPNQTRTKVEVLPGRTRPFIKVGLG